MPADRLRIPAALTVLSQPEREARQRRAYDLSSREWRSQKLSKKVVAWPRPRYGGELTACWPVSRNDPAALEAAVQSSRRQRARYVVRQLIEAASGFDLNRWQVFPHHCGDAFCCNPHHWVACCRFEDRRVLSEVPLNIRAGFNVLPGRRQAELINALRSIRSGAERSARELQGRYPDFSYAEVVAALDAMRSACSNQYDITSN